MYVSLRNNDLFSKKRHFSFISPTEHDILGTIDYNSLKTSDVHSKIVSVVSIRWTVQAQHKNMCVSLRNNDLFSNTTFCIWSMITLWNVTSREGREP